MKKFLLLGAVLALGGCASAAKQPWHEDMELRSLDATEKLVATISTTDGYHTAVVRDNLGNTISLKRDYADTNTLRMSGTDGLHGKPLANFKFEFADGKFHYEPASGGRYELKRVH